MVCYYVLITCYGSQSDLFCSIPKHDERGHVKGKEQALTTVKTLLSVVLRPVEVASFRAKVLAKVVSAALSVMVVSVYSKNQSQLMTHSSQVSQRLTMRRDCAVACVCLTLDGCSPALRLAGRG